MEHNPSFSTLDSISQWRSPVISCVPDCACAINVRELKKRKRVKKGEKLEGEEKKISSAEKNFVCGEEFRLRRRLSNSAAHRDIRISSHGNYSKGLLSSYPSAEKDFFSKYLLRAYPFKFFSTKRHRLSPALLTPPLWNKERVSTSSAEKD